DLSRGRDRLALEAWRGLRRAAALERRGRVGVEERRLRHLLRGHRARLLEARGAADLRLPAEAAVLAGDADDVADLRHRVRVHEALEEGAVEVGLEVEV